jgi:phosphoribosylaminoimidazolecarboxamide formyltransferase/IMP cyclohydrolase
LIKSALISVFNKDGLAPIVQQLAQNKVTIYSTGGTQTFIEGLGIEVIPVEDVTGFPSIFGGRVKTLHPAIFGGILYRRNSADDIIEKDEHNIPEIDLVIVDLYPFEDTVAATKDHEAIIEKIDIGGVSLIRAAAKNYVSTCIVSNRNQYASFLKLLVSRKGELSSEDREDYAKQAFINTAHYDTKIGEYFADIRTFELRYGENPHQPAQFVANAASLFNQLHGKELSYNNLLDMDAAVHLMSDLNSFNQPAFAVIKHNNACGVAVRNNLFQAFKDALAGDPVSAFGGVFVCNKSIDKASAEMMDAIFFEILIAPGFDADAMEILQKKKNRIIIKIKHWDLPAFGERSILNGKLVQQRDTQIDQMENAEVKTNKKPTTDELRDLTFANILVKHTKSNAIILVKGLQLIGSGTGKTSRVDALRQAIHKAGQFGFKTYESVMASDAFFPFPDCVEIAENAGIKTVVQPGGSIKDQLSIDYCNNQNMCMLFTGHRHFKH